MWKIIQILPYATVLNFTPWSSCWSYASRSVCACTTCVAVCTRETTGKRENMKGSLKSFQCWNPFAFAQIEIWRVYKWKEAGTRSTISYLKWNEWIINKLLSIWLKDLGPFLWLLTLETHTAEVNKNNIGKISKTRKGRQWLSGMNGSSETQK